MNSDVFLVMWGQTLLFLWGAVTMGWYALVLTFSKSAMFVKVASCVFVPVWAGGSLYLCSRIGGAMWTLCADQASLSHFDGIVGVVGQFCSVLLFGWLGQSLLLVLAFKALAPRLWERIEQLSQDKW
jgi:hypothetical protein